MDANKSAPSKCIPSATSRHRTVLIVGKTGNGKSTLANVLVGSHLNKPPTEVFKEGEFAGSATATTQEAEVTVESVTFKVVDTIGIGDTFLSQEAVLMQLARTCHTLSGGINQILYVSSGRFTKEEQESIDLLRHVIFDEQAEQFITMVRTRSPFFVNEAKRKKDVEQLKAVTDGAYLQKVIHVSNPSPEEEGWVTTRQKSRCLMLAWLEKCDKLYHPDPLKKIQKRVKDHVEEVDRLEKRLAELEKEAANATKYNKDLISELQTQHSKAMENATKALQLQAEENYQRGMQVRRGNRDISILWGLFKWQSSW